MPQNWMLMLGQILFIYCKFLKVEAMRTLELDGITSCNKEDEWYKYPKINAGLFNLFASSSIIMESKEKSFSIVTLNQTGNVTWFNPKAIWTSLLESRGGSKLEQKISPFDDFIFKLQFKDNKPGETKIETRFLVMDIQNIGYFIIGCLLFRFAKSLSRSTIFHYASGATAGVLLTWCFVLFVIYKFMPMKKYLTGLIVTISGAGVYFTQKILDNAFYLVKMYPFHVLTVSAVSALIAIAILYYYGPPSNDRALNLIQWFLQLSAIYLVYQSSYCKKVSITFVTILISTHFVNLQSFLHIVFSKIIPKKYKYLLHRIPKKRFLTLEEYEAQAIFETQKSLKELREFCSSPNCNTWDFVIKLKQPKRFAEFVKSGDHIAMEELDAYDNNDEIDNEIDDRIDSSNRFMEKGLIKKEAKCSPTFLATSHFLKEANLQTLSKSSIAKNNNAFRNDIAQSLTNGDSDNSIDGNEISWISEKSTVSDL